MSQGRRCSVRVVVQHLHRPNRYRLVVYGDGATYRPLEFACRTALVAKLRHIIHDIDDHAWPSHDNLNETRIIFTAEVMADESQFQSAGLQPR